MIDDTKLYAVRELTSNGNLTARVSGIGKKEIGEESNEQRRTY